MQYSTREPNRTHHAPLKRSNSSELPEIPSSDSSGEPDTGTDLAEPFLRQHKSAPPVTVLEHGATRIRVARLLSNDEVDSPDDARSETDLTSSSRRNSRKSGKSSGSEKTNLKLLRQRSLLKRQNSMEMRQQE